MDENKRKKLVEIKYEVLKCCGLCAYFVKPHNRGIFGTCSKNEYEHLKHSEPKSELSVTVFGGCPEWEEETSMRVVLHRFVEFQKI